MVKAHLFPQTGEVEEEQFVFLDVVFTVQCEVVSWRMMWLWVWRLLHNSAYPLPNSRCYHCCIFCSASLLIQLTDLGCWLDMCKLCTYVIMYVHVCMYVCVSVCMYACIYVCMYVCMYVCDYVCMYVCMYVIMYVHMYVCMYVYMYVCMYTCTHTHTHTVCCSYVLSVHVVSSDKA